MKKITVTGVIIGLLSATIIGSCGYAVYKYLDTDKSMVGKETDKISEDNYISSSVNVMLKRPDNWKQISSQVLLTHEEFAGIDGSTATIPVTAELARQFFNANDENISKYVSHNTTDVSYNNLINKYPNILRRYPDEDCMKPVRLVFATPPSEDEYAYAKSRSVTLEVEPIALDGFVFITHKDNPVDNLTVQQIQDIYTGKIKNWKEVGGKDEPIRAFQRTKNSGSQTAMEELVMKGKPMQEAPISFMPVNMGELVESVAEYENESAAIGYTYYYYINNLYKNPDIKVLSVDGIPPENDNLITKKYPFTAAYFVVIREDEPQDSVYRKLRDYMLTEEGQEIVKLAGYCPASERHE